MNDNLLTIINRLHVPKVILRYIMMNFLDIDSIKKIILTVKDMNVLDDFSKDFLTRAARGFINNCQNGYINIAQWIYELEDINIHADGEVAFRLACMNGQLNVAQWLYSLGDVDVDIDIDLDGYDGPNGTHYVSNAFNLSCENGHLVVAKWLYHILGHHFNSYCGKAFELACNNGWTNIAQWIFSLDTRDALNIDIYSDGWRMFCESCMNGYLDLAQWLYSVIEYYVYLDNKYQLQTVRHNAFRLTCRRGHLDIAQWLYSFEGITVASDLTIASDDVVIDDGECYSTDVKNWLYTLVQTDDNMIS